MLRTTCQMNINEYLSVLEASEQPFGVLPTTTPHIWIATALGSSALCSLISLLICKYATNTHFRQYSRAWWLDLRSSLALCAAMVTLGLFLDWCGSCQVDLPLPLSLHAQCTWGPPPRCVLRGCREEGGQRRSRWHWWGSECSICSQTHSNVQFGEEKCSVHSHTRLFVVALLLSSNGR